MVRTLGPLPESFPGSSAPGPHHDEDATLEVNVQATVQQVLVGPEMPLGWVWPWMLDQWCVRVRYGVR